MGRFFGFPTKPIQKHISIPKMIDIERKFNFSVRSGRNKNISLITFLLNLFAFLYTKKEQFRF